MTDIRWEQRFENLDRAFNLLEQGVERHAQQDLSDLEKEGIIQRFEYTFELAWKTLKDYLDYTGIVLEQITPRSVIKAAFNAKIIADGQAWIDMLSQRNLMAHTYHQEYFEHAISNIVGSHFSALRQVFTYLRDKRQVS